MEVLNFAAKPEEPGAASVRLAREGTPKAIELLVKMIKSPSVSDTNRLEACRLLLNHAFQGESYG